VGSGRYVPFVRERVDWVIEPVFELKGRFIQVELQISGDGWTHGLSVQCPLHLCL